MKINGKHLVLFARGSALVDKQGYLSKKTEDKNLFQRRWFVLKGNLLFYFDKKNDTDPLGLIILEGCRIEMKESIESFSFQLIFTESEMRCYILVADSQEDMHAWMKAMACSGYDYMKYAVLELEHQFHEVKQSFPAERVQNAHDDRVKVTCNLLTQESEWIYKKPSSSHKNLRRINPFDSQEERDSTKLSDVFDVEECTATFESTSKTFDKIHFVYGSYIQHQISQFQFM